MRGGNNLQRQLEFLTNHHGVTLTQPRRVPLTAPPDTSLILEGIASSSAIDIDRVSFAPRCFGSSLPTVPLLLEHDSARPAGHVTPVYTPQGGLRVRTEALSGDAARYGAFSIAVKNIQFNIVNSNRRDFHAEIVACDLTEISLTEYPHLPTALITSRQRGSARAEYYSLMARRVELLSKMIPIIEKGIHHGLPDRG